MERQHISLNHILIVINRKSLITIQICFNFRRFKSRFFWVVMTNDKSSIAIPRTGQFFPLSNITALWYWGSHGGPFNWTSIMPRHASLSDSWCNSSQSDLTPGLEKVILTKKNLAQKSRWDVSWIIITCSHGAPRIWKYFGFCRLLYMPDGNFGKKTYQKYHKFEI